MFGDRRIICEADWRTVAIRGLGLLAFGGLVHQDNDAGAVVWPAAQPFDDLHPRQPVADEGKLPLLHPQKASAPGWPCRAVVQVLGLWGFRSVASLWQTATMTFCSGRDVVDKLSGYLTPDGQRRDRSGEQHLVANGQNSHFLGYLDASSRRGISGALGCTMTFASPFGSPCWGLSWFSGLTGLASSSAT